MKDRITMELMIDKKTHEIIYASRTFLQKSLYSFEELVSLSFSELVSLPDHIADDWIDNNKEQTIGVSLKKSNGLSYPIKMTTRKFSFDTSEDLLFILFREIDNQKQVASSYEHAQKKLSVRDKRYHQIQIEKKTLNRNAHHLSIRSQKRLKRKEKLTFEQTMRIKHLINSIMDSFFVLNEFGEIFDAGGQDLLMEHKKINFADGDSFLSFFPLGYKNQILEMIAKTLETKKISNHRIKILKDLCTQWFELRYAPYDENKVLVMVRDMSYIKENKDRIDYMKDHDEKTGLYNRSYFIRQITSLSQKKLFHPISIMIADVNGLKRINDNYGEEIGDNILYQIAQIMEKNVPDNGFAARYGGDEFICVFLKLTEEKAVEIGHTIIDEIEKNVNDPVAVSVSFGVSTIRTLDDSYIRAIKEAEDWMIRRKYLVGPSMRSTTITVIINILHEKNKREKEHSERVAKICQIFGGTLGLSRSTIVILRTLGLLHDIGKIGIDEQILNKPSALTPAEYEEIKKHPMIGYRILSTSLELNEIAQVVLCHHERYDGKGYPQGLKEREIPYLARVISIVDTFDAITSDRPYRKAKTVDYALAELDKNAGLMFDPFLVKIFINQAVPILLKDHKKLFHSH